MPLESTTVNERRRVYHYADGSFHEFKNIAKLRVTHSGFHCLDGEGGEKYIVAPGWRYIDIEADEWSR